MSWALYRWVWRLESPLHIGAPPAGALNRTRLYVPARALWGALTAEIARRRNAAFPEYQTVGEQLQRETRISYLFPAELVNGEWRAWLPRYTEGEGLVWEREGDSCLLRDRAFRAQLLFSRSGTAITPEVDAAEEGTLREFDLISSHWKKERGVVSVGMVGYLFCKDDKLQQELREVEELFVGGDTRYGLGWMKRINLEPGKSGIAFGAQVDLGSESPVIRTKVLFAHLVHRADKNQWVGVMEQLVRWDAVGGGLKSWELAWVPGCCYASQQDKPPSIKIRDDGLWEML